jgi:hypothetical protein
MATFDQLRKCFTDRGYILSQRGRGEYFVREYEACRAAIKAKACSSTIPVVAVFNSLAAANAAINAGTYDRRPETA